MLPIGHTRSINAIVFNKEGTTIVTASQDNTVKVWEAKTGRLISVHKDSIGQITNVAFSPDEKYILITGENPVIKLWDPAKDIIRLKLSGHHFRVFAASFSADGKKIVSCSLDSTAKVWNASSGALLLTLKGHTAGVYDAKFSPDNKYVLTGSMDSTAKLWDANTGKLLLTVRVNEWVKAVEFSQDQKQFIVTGWKTALKQGWNINDGLPVNFYKGLRAISPDKQKYFATDDKGEGALWDAGKKIILLKFNEINDQILSVSFSSNSKIVLITTWSKAKTWNVETGKLLAIISGTFVLGTIALSPDSKNIVTGDFYGGINMYNSSDGKFIQSLKGFSHTIEAANYSPDQKLIVTASNSIKIWNANDGTMLMNLKGRTDGLHSAVFSSDGKKIVTGEYGGIEVWDATTGKHLLYVPTSLDSLKLVSVYSAIFSTDGKLIAGGLADSTIRIWDETSGEVLNTLRGHTSTVYSVSFNPDANRIASISFDGTLKVWDVVSGKLLMNKDKENVYCVSYSNDGKKLVIALYNKVEILDANSGKILKEFKDSGNNAFKSAVFSADDKKIITASFTSVAAIWDTETGKKINQFHGHTNTVTSAGLSADGRYLLTSSIDNTVKIWDANKGETLYSLLPLDDKDFLVVDNFNRYDGTEVARKLLYFTCGTEIISLDQVKDQLWVPGLAARIINHETINSKKLSDLNICGLTPEIKATENNTGYQFIVTPRKGGLSETVLYVNGIEALRYSKQQLLKTLTGYTLIVKRDRLKSFFIPDKQNPVTVKAYTTNNISSRGIELLDNETSKNTTPPNLYAVLVGVSDYKGTEMDLKYAAKDATDIGNAIKVSAEKMLNTDSNQHVFIYNLTTNKEHYLLPEKNSIKNVLGEIGKKATANDILLLFFAGHGVMHGERKQFYFLTADASYSTAVNAPADVGISTQELTEWMKPQNIRAQKRILIFDACNSGQAINDFVKLGEEKSNYVAARNDDKGQQIKAIEKLNERSGLFILSASASNQSAYEFSRYSQGLLTYSLLKAIKQDPGILEDKKYLNVSRWFNAAEKTVNDAVRETGNRQQPQIVSTSNFNIGIVDNEVIAKILIPQEKPLFTSSRFFNKEENILDDDIDLNSKIDDQLSTISARGTGSSISFAGNTNSADAFSLTGNYQVKGGDIVCKVNLRQYKQTRFSFETKGSKNSLDKLAEDITVHALKLISEIKNK